MSYTESVTVKMESGLKNRASNQAAEEGMSMSELGRKAMKTYLREKARVDIRRYGISKESVTEMIRDDGWEEWRLDHGIDRDDVTATFRAAVSLGGGCVLVPVDDVERNAALEGGEIEVIDDSDVLVNEHVIGYNDTLGILIIGR